MIEKHFEEIILKYFDFEFSPTQKKAANEFIRFFFEREEESLFILDFQWFDLTN